MTTHTTLEVQDRISAFLHDRGWGAPTVYLTEASLWAVEGPPPIGVFVRRDTVRVTNRASGVRELQLSTEAPDLLQRLGETLDGLGV
jgi:hypothetical protein